MDWVHCNICFKQPFSGEQNFFLTSCGHIYCKICLSSENKEKCNVCGNRYTTTHLSNQMQAEVQEYFQNPTEQLKKLVQVIQFQDGHRQKFLLQSKQATAKYKAAKEEMKKLFDANKVLKKKNKELEMALENKNKELELVKRHYSKHRTLNAPVPVHRNAGHSSTTHPFKSPMILPSGSPRYPSNGCQPSSQGTSTLPPNRLTLPYNNGTTPNNTTSPADNYYPKSNKSSGSKDGNLTPGQHNYVKGAHTPQGTQPSYLDQYRGRDHYSSQSNTPAASFTSSGYKSSKSPLTPGYSPNIRGASARVGIAPLLTQSICAGRPPLTPPTTGIELINLYSQIAKSAQK